MFIHEKIILKAEECRLIVYIIIDEKTTSSFLYQKTLYYSMSTKVKKVGKYLVNSKELIGEGSFSTVYKATQQLTQQVVAVKIIQKKDLEVNQTAKILFFAQINILKQLKSVNIIKLLQFCQTKNNYYVFEQYANEGSLRNMMKQNKQLPQKKALFYISQILNGFIQLIKLGITHRDLKPENILICNGNIKIADFGLSKQSQSNQMKTPVGTPYYMSPQILKGQPYTNKCDIWSLGLLLYQMIYGNGPWSISNKMLSSIQKSSLKFPTDLQISYHTKDFIRKCLQKKQQDRFDWEDIYRHPLFADQFQAKLLKVDIKGSLSHMFVMSELRNKIISQNIQFNLLIDKLSEPITKQVFKKFINEINGENINMYKIIYKHCQKYFATQQLTKKQIYEYFCLFEITKQLISEPSIMLSKQISQSTIPQRQQEALIASLKAKILQKHIDLYELFKSCDKNRRNGLTYEQFKMFVLNIGQFKQDDIVLIFTQLDQKCDSVISFRQIFKKLYERQNIKIDKPNKINKARTYK